VFIQCPSVSPKELTAFRMAPDVMKALRRIRETEGIPVAVQIDFAVRDWLKKKGVHMKAERKRAGTRTRS
jgi:hypothetical protein